MNKSKSHLILINLSNLNIKIAGFYRSPSTKSGDFLEILESLLDKTDNLICFGDFNYDILKPDDSNVHNYLQIIKNNGFHILNSNVSTDYTYREDKNGREHLSILDLFSQTNFVLVIILPLELMM